MTCALCAGGKSGTSVGGDCFGGDTALSLAVPGETFYAAFCVRLASVIVMILDYRSIISLKYFFGKEICPSC